MDATIGPTHYSDCSHCLSAIYSQIYPVASSNLNQCCEVSGFEENLWYDAATSGSNYFNGTSSAVLSKGFFQS